MRTVGLSLGLALLFLLHAEAWDCRAAGLDKRQIAGTWHITALASDSESFLRRKDHLKMGMATIAVLEDGNLKVSFAIPLPEGCDKSQWIYRRTENPCEYYSAERGNKTVQVVDTDGKTYAVIFASRVKEGKTFHMLRLYSKTQEMSPQITSLFKKFAREKGFTDEMIRMLPSQEECRLDEA